MSTSRYVASSASTPWPTLFLIVGAGVVSAFQIGKAPAALGHLRADLGFGLVTAGWVISMFNVIGVALGTALGAFSGWMGERRAVLSGLALTASASLLGAVAQGPVLLLATRFVEGLGFLLVAIGVPALIIRLARPADLQLAFGVWGTYMPAGTAAMMMASPLFLGPFGWRGLWIANAVLVAAFALALGFATREIAAIPARAHASAQSLRGLFADMRTTLAARGPLLVALTFASYTLQFIAVLGFLPTVLMEQEGMGQARAATLTAIAIAANALGNLVAGALLHRGVARWLLVASASAVMGVCALGIYSSALSLPARYLLVLLFSTIGGMLPATVLGWAPAMAPEPRLVPTSNGLLVQGSHLGQMIGPPALAAMAVASGSWAWSPSLLVVSAACGVGLALSLRHLERSHALRPAHRQATGAGC